MVYGTLPPEWGSNGFQALTELKLQLPMLSGTLPPEWGSPQNFCELAELWLLDLSILGTLPALWGDSYFQALTALQLQLPMLSGTLPPEWGSNGFQALTDLELRLPKLSGTLPPEWGSPSAFPELMSLLIDNTNITGILAATTRCNTL